MRSKLAFILLAPAFLSVARSQDRGVWRDPSPHKVRFVTVAPNVRLEVLDWGGSGRPLILLSGGGGTAHLFDDFATKLTSDNHVFAITRRGFGASTRVNSGYGADRLGDDVLAVMDALKLNQAVLVGESFGGAELSSMASRHPNRVAGLVYLDAAYWYAFDNGKGSYMAELPSLPNPPEPTEADLASFATYAAWSKRVWGVRLPEAELWVMMSSSRDRRVGELEAALAGIKKYAELHRPALAIYAVPANLGAWFKDNTDPQIRAATREFLTRLTDWTLKQAKAFEDGVPGARVVRMPDAYHIVFLSNEADVLREMRAFFATLK